MDEIEGVTFRLNPQVVYGEEAQDKVEELFQEMSFVLDGKHDRIVILVLSKIIVSIVKQFIKPEEMLETIFKSMRADLNEK